jgi:hypothetical protein
MAVVSCLLASLHLSKDRTKVCLPVISTLRRLRRENREFKVSQRYMVRICLGGKKQKRKQNYVTRKSAQLSILIPVSRERKIQARHESVIKVYWEGIHGLFWQYWSLNSGPHTC